MNPQQKKYYIGMAARLVKDSVTAVSIDVFSVLVCRPLWFANDLFYAMEKDFSALYKGRKTFHGLRRYAEKKVRKKNVLGNATLDDIYNVLAKKAGLNKDDRQRLMECEAELEVHLATPRKCGIQLYRDAIECGKKVILTCDTHLPESVVVRILEKCGIVNSDENKAYNALLISNNLKVNKDSGTFYPLLLKRFRLKPHQLIHIGGDIRSDVEMPVSEGIEALYLADCRELMAKSGNLTEHIEGKLKDKLISGRYVNLRCAMALYAVYAFDFPSQERFGGIFCGDDKNKDFLVSGALALRNGTDTDAASGNTGEFLRLFRDYFSGLESFGYSGLELIDHI